MLIRLSDATAPACGGKAATLATLLRHGLPVPDGFVVPRGDERANGLPAVGSLRPAIALELERLGDPVVAVRSSAADEDAPDTSAAGQYETVIGISGVDDVCDAVARCWASACSERVSAYRSRTRDHGAQPTSGIAVLIQPVVEADASGVLFTPRQAGDMTRIEASWGLGIAVVGGSVSPDTYEVAPDRPIRQVTGGKEIRVDLDHEHGGTTTTAVPGGARAARVLDDGTAMELGHLGTRIATILGGPQDIEWAVKDGKVWILQARPITAPLPGIRVPGQAVPARALTGTPGSHGTVTATARIVRSPSAFPVVRPGDILICPYTDPAWTPLFAVAAGVVTETGGALSHAAIIAREYGIPAVLGIAGATRRIENGSRVAVNGTAGTVTPL